MHDGYVTCKCGQMSAPADVPVRCDRCHADEVRRASGEAMRLFEPAPNQMPGQEVMTDASGRRIA